MNNASLNNIKTVAQELSKIPFANIIADIHHLSLKDGIVTTEAILKIIGIWYPQALALKKGVELTATLLLLMASLPMPEHAQVEDAVFAHIEDKGSNL